jgi:Fe-S cluster biogenesis protein NfuA
MADQVAPEHEQRARELHELLELVAAEVAKDGGTVSLDTVDYDTGAVTVRLGGACGTCSLTGATLEDGITRVLTQRLDWVSAVHGTIDESAPVTGRGGWVPRYTLPVVD